MPTLYRIARESGGSRGPEEPVVAEGGAGPGALETVDGG